MVMCFCEKTSRGSRLPPCLQRDPFFLPPSHKEELPFFRHRGGLKKVLLPSAESLRCSFESSSTNKTSFRQIEEREHPSVFALVEAREESCMDAGHSLSPVEMRKSRKQDRETRDSPRAPASTRGSGRKRKGSRSSASELIPKRDREIYPERRNRGRRKRKRRQHGNGSRAGEEVNGGMSRVLLLLSRCLYTTCVYT